MSTVKKGSIILLNGVSSAGKSTIIQEVVALDSSVCVLKIDDWFPGALEKKAIGLGWQKSTAFDPWSYLQKYVERETGRFHFDTEIRNLLFSETVDFYQKAKQLCLEGNRVIIDTVLEYEDEYQRFENFFFGLDVHKILVYCPIQIVSERVNKRNASGITTEQRSLFQSFEQFFSMFVPFNQGTTELIVDVVKTTTLKTILNDAIESVISQGATTSVVVRLNEFYRAFSEKFLLESQDEVALVPQHVYSKVINSYISAHTDSAKCILKFFEKI